MNQKNIHLLIFLILLSSKCFSQSTTYESDSLNVCCGSTLVSVRGIADQEIVEIQDTKTMYKDSVYATTLRIFGFGESWVSLSVRGFRNEWVSYEFSGDTTFTIHFNPKTYKVRPFFHVRIDEIDYKVPYISGYLYLGLEPFKKEIINVRYFDKILKLE